jgi:hypothetical protein
MSKNVNYTIEKRLFFSPGNSCVQNRMENLMKKSRIPFQTSKYNFGGRRDIEHGCTNNGARLPRRLKFDGGA